MFLSLLISKVNLTILEIFKLKIRKTRDYTDFSGNLKLDLKQK